MSSPDRFTPGLFYPEEENHVPTTLKWAEAVVHELQCDCGNKQFVIGVGSYLTCAICTACKREFRVHEG